MLYCSYHKIIYTTKDSVKYYEQSVLNNRYNIKSLICRCKNERKYYLTSLEV